MTDGVEATRPGLHQAPIAIVGMAALFPDAPALREYWQNIACKRDCIRDVDPSRWDPGSYYDADPAAPDKTYSRRGGFIPEVDFEPLEFGIPPKVLEVTDGSQLLALVVAREALRDAGYLDAGRLDRQRAGVILGVVGISMQLFGSFASRLQYPLWEQVLDRHGLSAAQTRAIVDSIKLAHVPWQENSFPGMLGNVIAGRIANRFDLGGTNCVVDAACGSSLAAVKMAVSELVEHRCDLMITGGVDVDNSIFTYLCFSKTPALSRREEARPFDARADGMMVGEGIGMLVLKRLADAERDGDRIYAVLRGIGSSSDGRGGSIYAPAAAGQARALARAYQDAGCEPASIGLLEAHGTGTVAGDACELQALHQVFGGRNGAGPRVALGSVKSQIGHTKAAAGAASLIKAALALHHKVLPPTLHAEQPSASLQSGTTPFYVNTELRPWIQAGGDSPRRAGVSSFGFGGTNYHVVLEEHGSEHEGAYRIHGAARQLLLHAPTPGRLLQRCRELVDELAAADGDARFDLLADAAATPAPEAAARVGFVAESAAEACQLCELAIDALERRGDAPSWDHPRGIHYRQASLPHQGRVVALFSGQGSQYLEMGRELAASFPPMRAAFGRLDALFLAAGRPALSSVVFPPPAATPEQLQIQAAALQRTLHAQPAIAAFSFGLFKILRRAGFCPDFAAGHSFGEVTALWAAGALSDDDFLALSKARGEAMAAPGEPGFEAGGMLVVTGSAARVQAELDAFPELTVASRNSPRQLVLAGAETAIEDARIHFERQGMTASRLAVSAAFHSRFVGHARCRLTPALEAIALQPPRIPVFSNASGERYPESPPDIRRALAEQPLRPVLFQEEIEGLYRAGGSIFVEIGPRNILTTLVKEILGGRPHLAVALNPSSRRSSDRQLREAVVHLMVAGLPLGDLDPYRLRRQQKTPCTRPSSMRLALSGKPYVSPETRAAFAAALAVAGAAPPSRQDPARAAMADTDPRRPPPDAKGEMETSPMPHDLQLLLQSLERNLARLHDHQAALLHTHDRYLQEQSEHAQAVLSLLRQQLALVGHDGQAEPASPLRLRGDRAPAAEAPVTEALAEPAGVEVLPALEPRVRAVPAQPVTASGPESGSVPRDTEPAPTVAGPPGAILRGVLEVVSDKTGYPTEMLEPAMDLEADLGIDSIKKVEILGALRERFPSHLAWSAAEAAELSTLGQIAERLGATAAGPRPADVSPPTSMAAPVRVSEPVATDAVARPVLALVSEKTGYPAEMLELAMDMEADLGIDSIKKVEILAGVQERFPGLPAPDPDAAGEMRTLEQVVTYVARSLEQKKKPGARPSEPVPSSAGWSA
jgi:polyketide-type polyunsaturated fatty acid synthase PfaA